MGRKKQVVGGVVLAALTVVVVSCAVFVLWLAAPSLTPPGQGTGITNLRVVNPDAKILRPIPPAQIPPRPDVVDPTPSETQTIVAARPRTANMVRRSTQARSHAAPAARASSSEDRDTNDD